ncbi:unnamed protein product [Dicrocoelium dendriticum]|nr:unnamed protein product [Dicrocoelium dendriticum]
MEAVENRFIKPFDTVVNFNEDFHSTSEPPEKINVLEIKTNAVVSEAAIQDTHSSGIRTKRKRANMVILQMRSSSEDKVSKQIHRRPPSSHQQYRKRASSVDCPIQRSADRGRLLRLTRSQSRLFLTPERDVSKRPNLVRASKGSSRFPDDRLLLSAACLAQHSGMMSTLSHTRQTSDKVYPFLSEHLKTSERVNGSAALGSNFSVRPLKRNTKPKRSPKLCAFSTSSTNLHSVQAKETGPHMDTGFVDYNLQLKTLQEQLKDRLTEAEKVIEQLTKVKANEKLFKTKLLELSQSGSVKAHVVLGLKAKVAELFAEVESLRCAYARALDHQADLQEEVASLKRSRDWFEDQLRLTQTIRDRVEAEADRLRGLLKNGNEVNHRLTHENACLQAQLICNKASLTDVKRSLSHQLESIRIDMIEREAILERMAVERADLERLNVERSNEVSNLQAEVNNLKAELLATDNQVTHQRSKLEQMELALLTAEQKRASLQEMLCVIEGQHCAQEEKLNEQGSRFSEALARIQTLEADCENKNSQVSSLMEDKTFLTAALESALKEKETLNFYLCSLKDNLSGIEDSFDKVRLDLELKNVQLSELCEQRAHLTDKLGQAHVQLRDCYDTISKLARDKEDLSCVVNKLRRPSDHHFDSTPDGVELTSKILPPLIVQNSASDELHKNGNFNLVHAHDEVQNHSLITRIQSHSASPVTQESPSMKLTLHELTDAPTTAIYCESIQHGTTCMGAVTDIRHPPMIALTNSASFSIHPSRNKLIVHGPIESRSSPPLNQRGNSEAAYSSSGVSHTFPYQLRETFDGDGLSNAPLLTLREETLQPQHLHAVETNLSYEDSTKTGEQSVSRSPPRDLSAYFGRIPQEHAKEQSNLDSPVMTGQGSESWCLPSSAFSYIENRLIAESAVVHASTQSVNGSNSATFNSYTDAYRDSAVVRFISQAEPEIPSSLNSTSIEHHLPVQPGFLSDDISSSEVDCTAVLKQGTLQQTILWERDPYAASLSAALDTSCCNATTQTALDYVTMQQAEMHAHQSLVTELNVTKENLRVALLNLAAAREESHIHQHKLFPSQELQSSTAHVDELDALRSALKRTGR